MLGEANISMAGAGDAKKANMIARTMIYSHGYGRRLGPVGMMGHRTGYLSGDDSDWIATIGSEVAQVAFLEVEDVSNLSRLPCHQDSLCLLGLWHSINEG